MMLVKTRVAPSSIHGLGSFAQNLIPAGTPIWKFQPGFDHAFTPEPFAALPLLARHHTRWFCYVQIPDLHVILSGDHACFINHSACPNTGSQQGGPEIQHTIALREIAPGEEITCNYHAYDADTPGK